MSGLIVINGYSMYSSTLNQVQRLSDEFEKLGVKVDTKKATEIVVTLVDDHFKVNLPPYDFVIFLDKDRYLSHVLEQCGYRLFNSASAIETCDDKMMTHIALTNAGIKMPKTISAPLCYLDSEDYSFLDKVIEELGFPIVVKECYGSKGSQVYLAKSYDELLEIEKRIRKQAHLYQQFIIPGGIDYRLIVIDNKVIATMERSNKNDFRSNIALGGGGKKAILPASYLVAASLASRAIGLDYCGIDLLKGPDGEPILCEVNSNAFFEGIESSTGVNVAKAYALHILKKINKI